MKYRIFYFDITAENEKFFDDRYLSLNNYAKCPGLSEVTEFLCMDIDEGLATILKLTYPRTKIYEIRDL